MDPVWSHCWFATGKEGVVEVGPSEQRSRGPWETLPLLLKGQISSGPMCPSSALRGVWGEVIRSCKAVFSFDWEAQKLGTPTRKWGQLGVKAKASGCCVPGAVTVIGEEIFRAAVCPELL